MTWAAVVRFGSSCLCLLPCECVRSGLGPLGGLSRELHLRPVPILRRQERRRGHAGKCPLRPVRLSYFMLRKALHKHFSLICSLGSGVILIVFPQRCKPTAHGILPFVYVDEWSSLVLSSVSLIHECGCDPGEKTQDPEVTTPS